MNFNLSVKFCLFVLFLASFTLAEAQSKRWILLSQNEDKETFIDTSSIKITDDQLSVWVLDIFNQPEEINDEGLKAKRTRTQYLFNIAQNTYSVIGNLYYDEVGKIISQSYNPRIGGIGKSFYQNIESNPIVYILYEDLKNYLSISTPSKPVQNEIVEIVELPSPITDNSQKTELDTIQSSNELAFSEIQQNVSVSETDITKESTQQSNNKPIEFIKAPTNIGDDSDKDNIDIKENINSDDRKDVRIAQIYDPVTGEYIEIRSEEPVSNKKKEVDLSNYSYNDKIEARVTNTIFTDGTVYCFQVSSWKQKRIAENELRKLKRKGHNAFIVAAKPSHKRGTWYRVRVGFFNSREQAEEYRGNM